jgi:exonuclease III
LGDPDGPEVIGLAEVENRRVLEDLVANPRLKKHGYKIAHHDSPDERGIDVALLYKEKAFKFLYDQTYPVTFPDDPTLKTRDILLVKGIIAKDQELCIMVNHWPSRRGGAEKSEPRRMRAAGVAHHVVDSIMDLNRDANVILVGDFNDEPTDKSISDTLKASYDVKGSFTTHLYNPMKELQAKGDGSLMYNKQWDMFDQIILSTSLVNGQGSLFYKWQSAAVYRPTWMQVAAEGDWKTAPSRSILKNEFQENGYSDHFPVYVTLLRK